MENNKSNIISLGCRLNIYESEVIKSLTKKHNINDYTIINSCAVTNEAEKKVCYEIRKYNKYSLWLFKTLWKNRERKGG